MQIYFSLLVAIIGAIMWGLCARPKLQEAGRLLFFAGVMGFVFNAGPIVGIPPKG